MDNYHEIDAFLSGLKFLSEITKEEIHFAMKRLKGGKMAGADLERVVKKQWLTT